MANGYINNFLLLFVLFTGNILLKNYNLYFLLVYISLIIYHIYIFQLIYKKNNILNFSVINYISFTFLLFVIVYFLICDPNPFSCIIVFIHFFLILLKQF